MALNRIVIDTCVIESALRSRLGASFQILSNIHRNRFRFGISVPLHLEYESRIELVSSISNEIIRYETMQFFAERSRDFDEHDFLHALEEIPTVEPDKQDRLN